MWESFGQAFPKACGVEGQRPHLRRFSFLITFFFCAYDAKRKK
jgi:hypothetical protein